MGIFGVLFKLEHRKMLINILHHWIFSAKLHPSFTSNSFVDHVNQLSFTSRIADL